MCVCVCVCVCVCEFGYENGNERNVICSLLFKSIYSGKVYVFEKWWKLWKVVESEINLYFKGLESFMSRDNHTKKKVNYTIYNNPVDHSY